MVSIVTNSPSYIINSALEIGQKNWDDADFLLAGQTGMQQLFKTVALNPQGPVSEFAIAEQVFDVLSLDFADPLLPERRVDGDVLLNRRLFNDALLVVHRGQVVHESYRNGMTANDRHVIHSCTKSLCAFLAIQAIACGLLSVQQVVSHYIPEYAGRPEWEGVTIQHVLDMQAGINYSENYQDPNAHYWQYARAAGYYPPLPGEEAVGVKAWVINHLNERNCEPGTAFVYNSCLTNVLGLVLEVIYKQPLADIFEQNLYQKVGAESAAYFNTDAVGFPITEGQLSMRLRDFARCASLVMQDGVTPSGEQLLPAGFFHNLTQPDAKAQQAYHAMKKDTVNTSCQYKHQFWVLEPEQQRLAMLGIHGQFAWYDLDLDLMIVGMGSYPKQASLLMRSTLKTLWHGIANALQ